MPPNATKSDAPTSPNSPRVRKVSFSNDIFFLFFSLQSLLSFLPRKTTTIVPATQSELFFYSSFLALFLSFLFRVVDAPASPNIGPAMKSGPFCYSSFVPFVLSVSFLSVILPFPHSCFLCFLLFVTFPFC